MRKVEIGAMPTSLGVAGGRPELDIEQGAAWEDLFDGKGGGIRFVDSFRDRKESFAGKANNLVEGRHGWCAAMAVVPESGSDTVAS